MNTETCQCVNFANASGCRLDPAKAEFYWKKAGLFTRIIARTLSEVIKHADGTIISCMSDVSCNAGEISMHLWQQDAISTLSLLRLIMVVCHETVYCCLTYNVHIFWDACHEKYERFFPIHGDPESACKSVRPQRYTSFHKSTLTTLSKLIASYNRTCCSKS